MADMTMIWNAILTMAIGGFLWWIRSTSAAISKVKDELAKAKEQMALNYATKEDVKDDMSQLMQRFDRLESKIDDMIRREPIVTGKFFKQLQVDYPEMAKRTPYIATKFADLFDLYNDRSLLRELPEINIKGD